MQAPLLPPPASGGGHVQVARPAIGVTGLSGEISDALPLLQGQPLRPALTTRAIAHVPPVSPGLSVPANRGHCLGHSTVNSPRPYQAHVTVRVLLDLNNGDESVGPAEVCVTPGPRVRRGWQVTGDQAWGGALGTEHCTTKLYYGVSLCNDIYT